MPKRRRRKTEQFGYEPSARWARIKLEEFVTAINKTAIRTRPQLSNITRVHRLDYSPVQSDLRRIMQAWTQSGPNLRELFDANPKLFTQIEHGRTVLCPTDSGFAHLDWAPTPENSQKTPEQDALDLFVGLIVNPEWEMLGGPCPRCDNYFVKKSARQKVYCSRICGAAATARTAVRQHRERAQAGKLRAAKEYINEWLKTNRKQDWKEWVVRRASQKYGITKNWLTRAINLGTLGIPK